MVNKESENCIHKPSKNIGIPSLPISWLMLSHFQKSRASESATVSWDSKCHSDCPSFCTLSLSFYCRAQCHIVWDIPLFSSSQLSQILLPCPTLFIPILTETGRLGEGERQSRKYGKS